MANPRRTLRRSIPPLWLIGLCLFLPAVRACSRVESPAEFLVGDGGWFIALLTPYVVAQILGILAIVALARGRVGRGLTVASAGLALAASASAVALSTVGFDGRRFDEAVWSALAGAAFVAGVLVMVRARRLEPWTRLARLHAAFTIFTLPVATLLLRIIIGDGIHKVGVGAPLFVAAVAALVVVHARGLWRTRDPIVSSSA